MIHKRSKEQDVAAEPVRQKRESLIIIFYGCNKILIFSLANSVIIIFSSISQSHFNDDINCFLVLHRLQLHEKVQVFKFYFRITTIKNKIYLQTSEV